MTTNRTTPGPGPHGGHGQHPGPARAPGRDHEEVQAA